MGKFHHRPLPDFSALLSGPNPPSDFVFLSDRLQISYFNTNESRTDPCLMLIKKATNVFWCFKEPSLLRWKGKE